MLETFFIYLFHSSFAIVETGWELRLHTEAGVHGNSDAQGNCLHFDLSLFLFFPLSESFDQVSAASLLPSFSCHISAVKYQANSKNLNSSQL